MSWFGSMAVGVVVFAIAFLVGRGLLGGAEGGQIARSRLLSVGAPVAFLLWAGLSTAAAAVHQVPAGSVGVLYQFGAIVGQVPDGLQVISPWQTITIASVQVQKQTFARIEAFSEETQDIFVTATINYSVSPTAVQRLYREVGPDWFVKLIEPRVLNFFKEEAVKYKTVDVAPRRETIRIAVKDKLSAELQPFSITVHDLLIDNIDFTPQFKLAIEQKQVATQDALREQQRVEQRRQEALQKIETAKGDAEALRINAEAQAGANRLIAQSLTPELIQFQAVQKLVDNIQIMLVPSGQGLIIDAKGLLGSTSTQP